MSRMKITLTRIIWGRTLREKRFQKRFARRQRRLLGKRIKKIQTVDAEVDNMNTHHGEVEV